MATRLAHGDACDVAAAVWTAATTAPRCTEKMNSRVSLSAAPSVAEPSEPVKNLYM